MVDTRTQRLEEILLRLTRSFGQLALDTERQLRAEGLEEILSSAAGLSDVVQSLRYGKSRAEGPAKRPDELRREVEPTAEPGDPPQHSRVVSAGESGPDGPDAEEQDAQDNAQDVEAGDVPSLRVLSKAEVWDATYTLVRHDRSRFRSLTTRESEVGHLAANGLQNKDIAHQLGIRPSTVAAHLRRIFIKLEVVSRAELGRHRDLWS